MEKRCLTQTHGIISREGMLFFHTCNTSQTLLSCLRFCSLRWTRRRISRTSSTASSSTSSCLSRRSTKKWTRPRKCAGFGVTGQLSSAPRLRKECSCSIFRFESSPQLRITPGPRQHVCLCLTCLACAPRNPFIFATHILHL